MKLTVDIPEKDYKFIRDTYKQTGLSFIPPAIKCECTKAVYNGTPYEERKTGKWKFQADTMYHYECPFCGYLHQYKDNFCPLCGAKMEVDE